jgi:hypothetical protein
MADSFAEFQEQNAPGWLQGEDGKRWSRAQGEAKDGLLARAVEAVKLRMPGICPPDGLAAIGSERGMPRGPNESTESYRARIADAWQTWPWAGTAYGLLRALRAAGYVSVTIAQVLRRAYALDANGDLVVTVLDPGWGTGDGGAFWSKFAVIFYAPGPLPPAGDPTDQLTLIRLLVRQWKSAHATCDGIYVVRSGWMFGFPPTPWGIAHPDFGGSVVERYPLGP